MPLANVGSSLRTRGPTPMAWENGAALRFQARNDFIANTRLKLVKSTKRKLISSPEEKSRNTPPPCLAIARMNVEPQALIAVDVVGAAANALLKVSSRTSYWSARSVICESSSPTWLTTPAS